MTKKQGITWTSLVIPIHYSPESDICYRGMIVLVYAWTISWAYLRKPVTVVTWKGYWGGRSQRWRVTNFHCLFLVIFKMLCLAHLLSSIMYPSKSNLKIFFKISKACQLFELHIFPNSSHSNTFKIGQIMSPSLKILKKLSIVPAVEAEDFTMACEVPHDPGVPGMFSPQGLGSCPPA